MAKTSKHPASAKSKAKAADVKGPNPAARRTSDKEAAARLEAEREEYYQANKARIDGVLAKCIKHFKDDEADIVRAVSRMLLDYYIHERMKMPKGRHV